MLLLALGLDEIGQVHERLERRAGIDWQLLYMPVAATGAVAWLLIVLRLSGLQRALLVAGTGAWAVAQLLEFLQWDSQSRRVDMFEPMMIVEELLEMTGSTLFLVGIYMLVRRAALSADWDNQPRGNAA